MMCAFTEQNYFSLEFCTLGNFSMFSKQVIWALNNEPAPLTAEQRYTLSWEAATDRFITASKMTYDMMRRGQGFSDKFSLWMHELASGGSHGDLVRSVAGGKAAANQAEYIREHGSADPEKRISRERMDTITGVSESGDGDTSEDSDDTVYVIEDTVTEL